MLYRKTALGSQSRGQSFLFLALTKDGKKTVMLPLPAGQKRTNIRRSRGEERGGFLYGKETVFYHDPDLLPQ